MKKMNKKFIAGTAFAISAAAVITGCGMPAETVYGPPPSETVETTSGMPSEPVYGPPPSETVETAEQKVTEETAVPAETFSPETEVQEDVYGPPEFFN